MNYPIVIVPLSEEDGGGFAGYVPDLPGCMSDGATPAEAIENTLSAFNDWVEASRTLDREIPAPGSAVQRARESRAELIRRLEQLDERTLDLGEQLDDIRRDVGVLIEALESNAGWERFNEILGLPVPRMDEQRPILQIVGASR